MSISEARKYLKSKQDLSEKEKTHLNTLLDNGSIVPTVVSGEDAKSLREVILRNPLTSPGKLNYFQS